MKTKKEIKDSLLERKEEKNKGSNNLPSNLIEIRKNIGNKMMGDFLNELDGSTEDIREKYTKKSETMKAYEPNQRDREKKGKLEKVSHLSMDSGEVSIGKFKEKEDMVIVPHMKNAKSRTANFKDMKRVKGVSATKKNFKGAAYLSNPNGPKESAMAIITGSRKKPNRIINNIQKAIQNEDISSQNKLLEDVFPFLNDKKEWGMIDRLKEERKKVIDRQEKIQSSKESTKEKKSLLDYKTYLDAQIIKLREIIERKKRRRRKLLTRLLSIQLKMKMMKKAGVNLEQRKFTHLEDEGSQNDLLEKETEEVIDEMEEDINGE